MTSKADPSDYDTFYQSNTGYIIPTITGTISCISSVVVIFIILRTMRNTAYHRIMFAMSLSDIISSTAIALTTIPMPSDVIYAYAGSSYGTTGTCVAQGLAYIVGSSLAMSANCILHIYYLCKLGFKMPEPMYRKRVEPVCFLLLFVPNIMILLTFKRYDLINPTPYESYCSSSHYPYRCQVNDDVECIRGNTSVSATVTTLVNLGFAVNFGIMSTSMLIVICKFYKTERAARRCNNVSSTMVNSPVQRSGGGVAAGSEDEGGGIIGGDATGEQPFSNGNDEAINSDIQLGLTKEITIQASMYISAFILTFVFIILTLVETSPNTFPFAEIKSIQVLKVIFQPLQGFFNMLIFIYHKVSQVRRVEKDLDSTWEGLKVVFCQPRSIPEIVISRIEVLHSQKRVNVLEFFARNAGDDDDRKPQSEVSRMPPSIQSEDKKRREYYTGKGNSVVHENAFDDNDLSYEQDSKSKLSGFSWLSNETGADGSR